MGPELYIGAIAPICFFAFNSLLDGILLPVKVTMMMVPVNVARLMRHVILGALVSTSPSARLPSAHGCVYDDPVVAACLG